MFVVQNVSHLAIISIKTSLAGLVAAPKDHVGFNVEELSTMTAVPCKLIGKLLHSHSRNIPETCRISINASFWVNVMTSIKYYQTLS